MSSKKTPKKARSTATTSHTTRPGYEISFSGPFGLFSPKADHFALLAVAVDKHCLRIFNVSNSILVAEHTVDAARVSSMCWLSLSLTEEEGKGLNPSTPARPRKRKKSASKGLVPESSQTELVGLGLTTGSLLLYSSKHARVLRVLSHPTSLSPILAIAPGTSLTNLWCSTADGYLILWNAARNELLKTYKPNDLPYTSLASCLNDSENENMDLLAANHVIKVLTVETSVNSSETGKIKENAALTGHTSSIKALNQDGSRLISHAEGDRVINIWTLPNGDLLANAFLDANVRQATAYSGRLLAVSVSDKISIFELPSTASNNKVLSLTPSSMITRDPKVKEEGVSLIAAVFIPDEKSLVRVASLKSGAKPIFEDVAMFVLIVCQHYLDEIGKYIPQVFLVGNVSVLATSTQSTLGITQRRYTENSHLAAGVGNGPAEGEDDTETNKADGDLDIDLAELSLGQRLTALSGVELDTRASDLENEGLDTDKRTKTTRFGKTRKGEERLGISTQSLSRTLIQALHSSDTRLLELCLMHSDESVILNTVKRLPAQLAVPLLLACVERLGRGARAGTGKGGGAGASAQRGTGLVRWIRAVLIVHTAHLVTMPDLATRLAGLHATITARLALRDPLLALSGRVDFILSQMELRSGGVSTPQPEKRKEGRKSKAPLQYVEGESESESVEQVDIEGGEDEGSVEDVELGGDSDESAESDEGSDEEDDEEDDENEDDEEGSRFNGFIDDEADEIWSAGSESSEEEDMT